MKIIEADHKQYIRLGDLYHLLHLMRWDMVYDKYDRDEDGAFIQKDGTKGLTMDDARIVSALTSVMTRILHNKVHACETPDEIRKLYTRIEDEFYMDKYVLIMKEEDEDGNKNVYFFRKYCQVAMEARLSEEGKDEDGIAKEMEDAIGDPVFTNLRRQAEYFEDYEAADSSATFIRHNYGLDVEVKPAWYFNPNVEQRFMDFINENAEGQDKEKE